MDSNWFAECTGFGSKLSNYPSERPGLPVVKHGMSFETICAHDIEQKIFQHPESEVHYGAITLYLQMDLDTFQSILFLREASHHSKELAKLHNSFFASPPKDLFKLIHDLRLFNEYSASSTIQRFDRFRATVRQDQQDSHRKSGLISKTAPEGMTYQCPSEKCKKTFTKAGHARKHVMNQHAEYLKLYPGWEPQQDLVSRPGSLSPNFDHYPQSFEADPRRGQRRDRSSSRYMQSHTGRTSTASSETVDLNDISPRSYMFSPSSGEGNARSRRDSKLSPFLPPTPEIPDMLPSYPYYYQAESPCMKRQRLPGSPTEQSPPNHDYGFSCGSGPPVCGKNMVRRHSYKRQH